MEVATPPRSQDEIVSRIKGCEGTKADYFGFRREVLIGALDFEHAKPFLKEGVTADEWGDHSSREALEKAAFDYYQFALGKAHDHRGLSASRSVTKLSEWAWLLGEDAVFEAMNADENYPQYGVPALAIFGEHFEQAMPVGESWFDRMRQGEPCRPDCQDGCSI